MPKHCYNISKRSYNISKHSYDMTKHIYYILILVAVMFTTASCDKVDDNGDLGGMWQLTEWRALPSGEVRATKTDAIFYSVQLNLMKFSIYNDMDTYHLARFSHRNDSLILGKIYARPDEKEVPATELAKYGVPPSGAFAIDNLTSSSMTLRSDSAVLTFRKY